MDNSKIPSKLMFTYIYFSFSNVVYKVLYSIISCIYSVV